MHTSKGLWFKLDESSVAGHLIRASSTFGHSSGRCNSSINVKSKIGNLIVRQKSKPVKTTFDYGQMDDGDFLLKDPVAAKYDAETVIELLSESGLFRHGISWFRNWCELKLRWSDGNTRYLMMPSASDAELVARARNDREVFDLANYVATTRISASVVLPPELGTLIVGVLEGRIKRPKGVNSGTAGGNWGRDFIIRYTARLIKDRHGVSPSKSGSKPSAESASIFNHSSSQLIALSMRDRGLNPPSVSRIQNIATGKKYRPYQYQKMRSMWIARGFDDENDVGLN